MLEIKCEFLGGSSKLSWNSWTRAHCWISCGLGITRSPFQCLEVKEEIRMNLEIELPTGLAKRILEAMRYLHVEKRVIHRDVKVDDPRGGDF